VKKLSFDKSYHTARYTFLLGYGKICAMEKQNEIEKLTQEYFTWLKDKTILKELEGWVEITTPYLDRHNDYIQIYVKKENNKFVLSDDGYIISDLIQSGCDLNTQKSKELLIAILNSFGVKQLKSGELLVYSTSENFALQKHNLIQAMLAIIYAQWKNRSSS